MSKIELALKASRSRHKYIRELGRYLLGKITLADFKINNRPVGLMPSQEKLISEIIKFAPEIDEDKNEQDGSN